RRPRPRYLLRTFPEMHPGWLVVRHRDRCAPRMCIATQTRFPGRQAAAQTCAWRLEIPICNCQCLGGVRNDRIIAAIESGTGGKTTSCQLRRASDAVAILLKML